jgi:uncharacterized membrane protein (DUF2068 family)
MAVSIEHDRTSGTRACGRPVGLWTIGAYKLAKALVVIAAGVVILRLSPGAVADEVTRVAARLGVSPESQVVHKAVTRLAGLDAARLEAVGVGVILYGLLYVAQGVGLLLQKRWAEYLVLVTTGYLIPIELYETFRTLHPLPTAALAINVVIMAYLIVRLRCEHARSKTSAA